MDSVPDWMTFYNHRWPGLNAGYLSPMQYEAQCRKTEYPWIANCSWLGQDHFRGDHRKATPTWTKSENNTRSLDA
jgi:hypothetical protein